MANDTEYIVRELQNIVRVLGDILTALRNIANK